MKIKITDTNKERINEYIKNIEGNATARTADYDKICWIIEQAVEYLERNEIPKKYRTGIMVTYLEYIGVRAYTKKGFEAATTRINITCGTNDWFLTSAGRDSIRPDQKGQDITLELPHETEEWIKDRALKQFYRDI